MYQHTHVDDMYKKMYAMYAIPVIVRDRRWSSLYVVVFVVCPGMPTARARGHDFSAEGRRR